MMFDEQPDGDPHGECAAEIHHLTDLVRWAYGKLHHINFTRLDDALKLDEMKLLLEHGTRGVPVCPATSKRCRLRCLDTGCPCASDGVPERPYYCPHCDALDGCMHGEHCRDAGTVVRRTYGVGPAEPQQEK